MGHLGINTRSSTMTQQVMLLPNLLLTDLSTPIFFLQKSNKVRKRTTKYETITNNLARYQNKKINRSE